MNPHLSNNCEEISEKFKKSNFYEFVKRFFDVILSILGIVLLSPVFLVTAVAIKIDSRGPVIFAQKRCGKNGITFKMYKFRSMVVDAEKKLEDLKVKNEMSGPVFKIKDDPRITRVGKFIRNKSIDEFPQLVNVIKGDMSIVGPRPPIDKEVLNYNSYQRQRLSIRPGLTCYWQVMGRNKIGFNEWVELDLKYIRERNFWLDIKLILKTFSVIFGDDNAY